MPKRWTGSYQTVCLIKLQVADSMNSTNLMFGAGYVRPTCVQWSSSWATRLRFMEDVKEDGHGDASERIDQGRQQRYRRNETLRCIQDVGDELAHPKGC